MYKLNNFNDSNDAYSYSMFVEISKFSPRLKRCLANNSLSNFERSHHPLTEIWLKEVFLELVRIRKDVKKNYEDMKTIYADAHGNGLRIELDNFGGSGLFNRSKKTISVGVIDFSVGLIEKCPKIDD